MSKHKHQSKEAAETEAPATEIPAPAVPAIEAPDPTPNRKSKSDARAPTAAERAAVPLPADGPGHLRSQGEVTLAKKAEPAGFSNAYMRSHSTGPAGQRGPSAGEEKQPAVDAELPPKPKPAATAPTSATPAKTTTTPAKTTTESARQQSASKPNASDLDATLPESKNAIPDNANAAKGSRGSEGKAGARTPTAAPNVSKAHESETALTAEEGDPSISLKVAVKMGDATLVMNPKSKGTFDDVEESAAPTRDAKPANTSKAIDKGTKAAAPNVAPAEPAAGVQAIPSGAASPKVQSKTEAAPLVGPVKETSASTTAPAQAVPPKKRPTPPSPKLEIKHDKREPPKPANQNPAAAKAGPAPAESAPAARPSVEAEPASDVVTAPEGVDALDGGDPPEKEREDEQDAKERPAQADSLSERRQRSTRRLRAQSETEAKDAD